MGGRLELGEQHQGGGRIIQAKYMATDPRRRSRVGGASWGVGRGGTVREGRVEKGKLEGRAKEASPGGQGASSFPLRRDGDVWTSTSELHPAMLAPGKPLLPLQEPVSIPPVCSPLIGERMSEAALLPWLTKACLNKSWGRTMGFCSASLLPVPQAPLLL